MGNIIEASTSTSKKERSRSEIYFEHSWEERRLDAARFKSIQIENMREWSKIKRKCAEARFGQLKGNRRKSKYKKPDAE